MKDKVGYLTDQDRRGQDIIIARMAGDKYIVGLREKKTGNLAVDVFNRRQPARWRESMAQ